MTTESRLAVAFTFPPRHLQPDEQALLAEWLEIPGNGASGYFSERRGDDPAFYQRIVVTLAGAARPTHLIFTPSNMDIWVVQAIQTREARGFSSLSSALNSIWSAAGSRKKTERT